MALANKDTTALFIGHSDCYGLSTEEIEKVIIELIHSGVTTFLCGGQGGFDRLCARCVYGLKAQYPIVKIYLVIPYLSFSVFDKDIFDEIIYPEGFERYHFKSAIPARNRYMIDNASYAVCYVNHGWGGAAKSYARAVKKKLSVTNLGKYDC